MKKILGISAFYHDSAAALVIGDSIVSAVQEERFTRIKHTAEFPGNAIKYCLAEAGLEISELDAIVFYDKPLLKFERLLKTYYTFAPGGLTSFLKAMPVWLKQKIILRKVIINELKEIGNFNKGQIKLLFSEHHLSHAASTFFPSPFFESAILTIDGVGEWCTASIGYGRGNKIKILKELSFPHSVGLLYSAFTYYLGFKVNSGEYKLMGLAPYGNLESEQTQKYINIIKEFLIDIKYDGSIWVNQKYFDYATGLRMVKDKKWEALFGFPRRDPETEIKKHHCNLALAIQKITEEVIFKMAAEARQITGSCNLCMAGGVALNCVANGRLLTEGIFKNIFIQPAAGDAGGAPGAALAACYMYFEEERKADDKNDRLAGSFLGPDYSDKEIESMNKKVKAVYKKYGNFSDLAKNIASKIAEGQVVGWFQGRMEFGPRALGNRSILADVRNPEMQNKLNVKIKFRESFRPFAPSVLSEDTREYFVLNTISPYMLLVAPVKETRRNKMPDNYQDLPFWDKLYFSRSDIQPVTHLDFSARIQTVHKETNPRYWELINSYKKLTGYGLVINTSFNVRGEPIVCTPYDAYRCFMSTEMDVLVINDFVYCKTEQPDWQYLNKWSIKYNPD